MCHGPQCLHVYLATFIRSVKTFCHEVGPAVLMKQAALVHDHARILCHKIICIFYQRISWSVLEAVISVIIYPIKLDDPVAISVSGIYLPRSYIAGLLIPCYDRLCSGPTGRCSKLKKLSETYILIHRKMNAFAVI